MKKIVCFGGGNAMPKAVLPGLKKYPVKISTVTSMVDSGGSTGQLRKDFDILPPGDIRRHLIALSDTSGWKKELFGFKFGHEEFYGGHTGHSFGNIFLGGLEYILKDYEKVLEIVHDFLDIKYYEALPATLEKTNVYAELENGEVIRGEDEIDVPKTHDGNLKIKRVFLSPEVSAYYRTLDSIGEADLISIGPGDLYSSIIPCFLPLGMREAIKKTEAKKVFICTPLTKYGETQRFSVLDFSNEIERYIECSLDYVVYNIFSRKGANRNQKKILMKDVVKVNEVLDYDKFFGYNLLTDDEKCEYNPNKIAEVLVKILQGSVKEVLCRQ